MSNGVTPATQPNKKLYNGGSEWQNDYVDLPDYFSTFYRNYDQTLGRWIGVDPKPESAESMSVYQYAGNNPVMGNDPMGDVIDLEKEEFMRQEAERHAMQESQAQARMGASLQNEQDMMMQEGWNWMSEAYISMKQEAAAVAVHTRQMASLLGQISAPNFSANKFVEVQGIFLPTVFVRSRNEEGWDRASADLWREIWAEEHANDINRDWVAANKQIAKGVDLAVPIFKVAKFYAYGAIGGAVIGGATRLAPLVGRFVSWLKPMQVVEEGVYDLTTTRGRYIGQSKNMFTRVLSHFAKGGKLANLGAKLDDLEETFHGMPGSTKLEREVYEQYLIREGAGGLENLINKVNPMGGRMDQYYELIEQVINKI